MLPRGPVSFQDIDCFEEKNVGMVGVFVYEPLSEEWAASATTTLRPLREPSVEKPYLHEIVLLLYRQHFSFDLRLQQGLEQEESELAARAAKPNEPLEHMPVLPAEHEDGARS